jgi:hypothetical protein
MRPSLLATSVGLLMLLLPAAAGGQTTATVKVKPHAVLTADGGAVLVTVSVRCTLGPGDQLLEGLVSVSQQQASGTGALNPACDGTRERIVVQVPTTGALFEPGAATASAFLLFLDPESGTTVSAQDSRTLRLHGT